MASRWNSLSPKRNFAQTPCRPNGVSPTQSLAQMVCRPNNCIALTTQLSEGRFNISFIRTSCWLFSLKEQQQCLSNEWVTFSTCTIGLVRSPKRFALLTYTRIGDEHLLSLMNSNISSNTSSLKSAWRRNFFHWPNGSGAPKVTIERIEWYETTCALRVWEHLPALPRHQPKRTQCSIAALFCINDRITVLIFPRRMHDIVIAQVLKILLFGLNEELRILVWASGSMNRAVKGLIAMLLNAAILLPLKNATTTVSKQAYDTSIRLKVGQKIQLTQMMLLWRIVPFLRCHLFLRKIATLRYYLLASCDIVTSGGRVSIDTGDTSNDKILT